jgi:hypothetical protein
VLSRKNTRRWMATAGTGVIAALGFGAYSAVAAPTPGRDAQPRKVTTSDFSVLIGPVTAKDGFKAEIEAVGCGQGGGVLLSYEKGNNTVGLDHTYAGPDVSCKVSKTLEAATLKVHWGDVLNVDVKIATKVRLKKLEVDACKGSYLEYRTARLTGTATTAVHKAAFGRLSAIKAPVKVLASVSSGCSDSGTSSSGTSTGTLPISGTSTTSGFIRSQNRAALGQALLIAAGRAQSRFSNDATTRTATTTTTTTTPTTTTTSPTTTTSTTATTPPTVTPDGSGTQFLAVFDDSENLVISAATDAPSKPLTVINDYQDDSPALDVFGSMAAVIQTQATFTPAAGDGSAQVTAAAPFAKGTLDFTATAACHSSTDALDGDLTGKIVVNDPIFGTLTYNGPAAVGAIVANGDADLSGC